MAKISDNISILQKDIQSGATSLAYFFFGEEDYLKQHYLNELRRRYADSEMNHIKISAIDSFRDALEKLQDASATPPMFSSAKLIELHEIDFSKLSAQELCALSEAASACKSYGDNILVLYAPAESLDLGLRPEQHPVYKALCEDLLPVHFAFQPKTKLKSWVQRHAQKEGITILPEDIDFLIDYCSRSMFLLDSEIRKLCIYAKSQNRDHIGREDILSICVAQREYEEFAFQNSLLKLSLEEALDQLLNKRDVGEEPELVMAQILSALGDMMKIRLCMDAGMNLSEISKKLGIHEYRTRLYMAGVKSVSAQRLIFAYRSAYDSLISLRKGVSDGYSVLRTLLCEILPSMKN